PSLWSKPRCVTFRPSIGPTAAMADAPGGNVTISDIASVNACCDGASGSGDQSAVIAIGALPGLWADGITVQPPLETGVADRRPTERARPARAKYFMAVLLWRIVKRKGRPKAALEER